MKTTLKIAGIVFGIAGTCIGTGYATRFVADEVGFLVSLFRTSTPTHDETLTASWDSTEIFNEPIGYPSLSAVRDVLGRSNDSKLVSLESP